MLWVHLHHFFITELNNESEYFWRLICYGQMNIVSIKFSQKSQNYRNYILHLWPEREQLIRQTQELMHILSDMIVFNLSLKPGIHTHMTRQAINAQTIYRWTDWRRFSLGPWIQDPSGRMCVGEFASVLSSPWRRSKKKNKTTTKK